MAKNRRAAVKAEFVLPPDEMPNEDPEAAALREVNRQRRARAEACQAEINKSLTAYHCTVVGIPVPQPDGSFRIRIVIEGLPLDVER